MVDQMTALNKIGEELGKIKGVTAITDVTGFGLLGHLIEMAEGSRLSAEIWYDKIPVTEGVRKYISRRIFPDATTRNWSSYSDKVKFEKGVNVMEAFTLLPDPQTNGGLLVSVREENIEEVKNILGQKIMAIGKMMTENEKRVWVK
jgi:selenide,water dikinase